MLSNITKHISKTFSTHKQLKQVAVKIESMAPAVISQEQLNHYDTFLFDADGVLWTGGVPVPGAADFITNMKSQGKRVFVITNNSTKTRKEYVQKLASMGFSSVPEENVISPAVVMSAYLKEHGYFGKKVYLIGTDSLRRSLEEGAGVKCLGLGPDPFDRLSNNDFLFDVKTDQEVAAVVVSFDGHISYPKIMRAANYLQNPKCGFFVTNEDYTFPGPNRSVVVPGTGCVAAAVKAATEQDPIVFGKPHTQIADYLMKHHHINPDKTLMFGDRLDTDMKFANDNGFTSCLMLTGVHNFDNVEKAEEAGQMDLVPDFTYSFVNVLIRKRFLTKKMVFQ